jgi:hypothetical protein
VLDVPLVEVSSLATPVKIIAGVLTEVLMGVLAVIWFMRWAIASQVEWTATLAPTSPGRRMSALPPKADIG